MKITKRQLRKVIREAMESQPKFPDVSHPSLSPYFNKKSSMQGMPGQWFTEYVSYSYNAGGMGPQGIPVYLLPSGMYAARVNGSYNNTISGKTREFEDPVDAIEAALDSSASVYGGPTARELLKKVGQRVTPPTYYGQD